MIPNIQVCDKACMFIAHLLQYHLLCQLFLCLHDADAASVLDHSDVHVYDTPIPGKWQMQAALYTSNLFSKTLIKDLTPCWCQIELHILCDLDASPLISHNLSLFLKR